MLQTVKSIDDVLAVRHEMSTITSLRIENTDLADTFVAGNMLYITSILGVELTAAQQMDMLDEVGQVGWLTMADFKLFLDRAKRTKFYKKDYQELLQEFWKYCDERLERGFSIESSKLDKVDNTPRIAETLQLKQLVPKQPETTTP